MFLLSEGPDLARASPSQQSRARAVRLLESFSQACVLSKHHTLQVEVFLL